MERPGEGAWRGLGRGLGGDGREGRGPRETQADSDLQWECLGFMSLDTDPPRPPPRCRPPREQRREPRVSTWLENLGQEHAPGQVVLNFDLTPTSISRIVGCHLITFI